MAEKEERQKRLLIKEYDLVCDLTDCKYCEEKDWCSEKNGMTRQETVERMAKAICCRENLLDSCSHCTFYYKKQNGEMCKEILTKREDDMEPSYIEIAKAALNALLEK